MNHTELAAAELLKLSNKSEDCKGEIAKEIMQNNSLTYRELANLIGIPHNTVHGWVNKRHLIRRKDIVADIEQEIDKRFKVKQTQVNTSDDTEFKQIAVLNRKLKTIIDIFETITELDNSIAKEYLKRIKEHVKRLNGK